MKTASASTIQKWPERSPLSPGQTDKIPGLVASEWNVINWVLSVDCFSLDLEKQIRNIAVSFYQRPDYENIDNCCCCPVCSLYVL